MFAGCLKENGIVAMFAMEEGLSCPHLSQKSFA